MAKTSERKAFLFVQNLSGEDLLLSLKNANSPDA